MSLRFVVCVEAGRLEDETVLLCESIRRFAGRFAQSPISAYRPREGEPLAEATRSRLADLGAELIDEPLNRDLVDYPLANKPYCLVHAEKNAAEDVLVLSDSDCVVVGEPGALELAAGCDAAVRPVGRVSDGSTGPGHDNEAYWERLYELLGVSERPFTETALRGKRIRAYWNTGLVVLRREAGVAAQWLEALKLLIEAPHLPERGINHAEQLSLAGVLAREPGRTLTLPAPYNYRLTRRPQMRDADAALDLSELVHIHYMRSFHVAGFLQGLRPPFDPGSEAFRWLAERLPLEPVIEVPSGEDGGAPSWKQIRDAARGQLARGAMDTPAEQ
jgi:hypothetical protein